jgi:hypothetical protein
MAAGKYTLKSLEAAWWFSEIPPTRRINYFHTSS